MREWNDVMDSIFNENRYFNNDEEANIYLINKRNEHLDIKSYEEEKYRDSLYYYNIFCTCISVYICLIHNFFSQIYTSQKFIDLYICDFFKNINLFILIGG